MENLMRQGDSSKDATRLATNAAFRSGARRRFWRGGLVETFAALRYRDEDNYDKWLEERDTELIATALASLSDRQLWRIGLSRHSLTLGIEDLKSLADRNNQIVREALEIVEESEKREEAARKERSADVPDVHQMAAE